MTFKLSEEETSFTRDIEMPANWKPGEEHSVTISSVGVGTPGLAAGVAAAGHAGGHLVPDAAGGPSRSSGEEDDPSVPLGYLPRGH